MQTKYIVAGWVAAAAVAVTASVAAVGVAQGGLLSHPAQPMSEDEVGKELAKAPAASESPSAATAGAEGSAEPSATAEQPTGHLDSVPDDAGSGENEAVFPSDGGTVLARCSDGMVELVWWAPEQGYQTDSVAQGPAAYAEVEFESEEQEYEYSLTCADGQPQASIEADG